MASLIVAGLRRTGRLLSLQVYDVPDRVEQKRSDYFAPDGLGGGVRGMKLDIRNETDQDMVVVRRRKRDGTMQLVIADSDDVFTIVRIVVDVANRDGGRYLSELEHPSNTDGNLE